MKNEALFYVRSGLWFLVRRVKRAIAALQELGDHVLNNIDLHREVSLTVRHA